MFYNFMKPEPVWSTTVAKRKPSNKPPTKFLYFNQTNDFKIGTLVDAQHEKDRAENKMASLLNAPLRKALSGIFQLGAIAQMAE